MINRDSSSLPIIDSINCDNPFSHCCELLGNWVPGGHLNWGGRQDQGAIILMIIVYDYVEL